MPIVYVDSEAAELIEASVQMFEAALNARVKRADPDKFISNSLVLQANKLASFRQQLRSADPPSFGMMPEPYRKKALRYAAELLKAGETEGANGPWEGLRGVLNAAGLPKSAKA